LINLVHAQFAYGRRFCIVNVVDDVTKDTSAPLPTHRSGGRRVARELSTIFEGRGKPGLIVSDHGIEFSSYDMLVWYKDSQVDWHLIAPGRPMQNGFARASTGACAMNCSTRP
jgi:transposase InsO family protein